MELKELPGELAYFVQQALASGTYQSADELVAEAVRLLKDREAERKARLHTGAPAHTDVSTSTPDDLVHAIRQAWKWERRGVPASWHWRSPTLSCACGAAHLCAAARPPPRPGCSRLPRRGRQSRPMGCG